MQIFELNYANKSSTLLVESVCRDLTRDQRRIVEGIVSELRPLFETTLSADQIQQIFQQAQEKQAASGGGRTAIGRAVDTTKAVGSAVGTAAGAINKAIDGLGRYLQTTAPVQYFDQKFEDLKQKISAKLGADSKTMAVIDQLGQYAKANPGKTAFVIGALTAVAAFSTGPAGGAVAGQVLRGAVELLKGEKLSTAVGKGIKTAAFGYLTGAVLDGIGDWFRTWTLNMVQYTPDIRQAKFGWSEKISWPGQSYTTARSLDSAYFLNADADRLSQLAKTFNSSGNPGAKLQAFEEFKKLLAKCAEPEYFERAKVGDTIARQLAVANDKLYQTTVNITKGIASAAQGAVQAATGTAKTPAAVPAAVPAAAPAPQVREGYTRLTNQEIREIFAIAGGELTEGPTWDKIKSIGSKVAQKLTTKQVAANLLKSWEKSGKPDDSGIIADILHDNNVSDEIIQDIYSAMNIELVTPAGRRYRPNPIKTATTGTATTGTAAGATTPTAAPGPAMDSSQIIKSFETMTPEQRTELIKQLTIIDDRDRLATGTNESRKRQRRI